jgi:hypothetical protein
VTRAQRYQIAVLFLVACLSLPLLGLVQPHTIVRFRVSVNSKDLARLVKQNFHSRCLTARRCIQEASQVVGQSGVWSRERKLLKVRRISWRTDPVGDLPHLQLLRYTPPRPAKAALDYAPCYLIVLQDQDDSGEPKLEWRDQECTTYKLPDASRHPSNARISLRKHECLWLDDGVYNLQKIAIEGEPCWILCLFIAFRAACAGIT